MAAGDIHRHFDSGQKAGAIIPHLDSVAPTQIHVDSLTAVGDSTERLKLITWRVPNDHPPSIERLNDSGQQAGVIGGLSLIRVFSTFDRYVTAVAAEGGEKLISWNVTADGNVHRMEDSGSSGLKAINGITAVGRDDFFNVVTGIWDIDKRLRLRTWRMNEGGHFDFHHDSGNQAGLVQAPPALVGLGNGIVLSAVVTQASNLKLITWMVDNEGSLVRVGHSGNSAGQITALPAAIELWRDVVVTAVRDSNTRLRLITWHVDNNGAIERRDDSGSLGPLIAGWRPALARLDGRPVTAVADQGERLRLDSWVIRPDGTAITRAGDSGSQAGTITAHPSIHPSPHSNTGVVTPVRTAGGSLKLITWTVE